MITEENASYCYLDVDVNHHREKLALSAAFVNATDARYGFSSPDLRLLGGSELNRLPELLSNDHEWKDKISDSDNRGDRIAIRPPACGNRIILHLDWDTAPMACENFATLCSNGGGDRSFLWATTANNDESNNSTTTIKNREKKIPPAPVGDSGKPLTYRGSKIHRAIAGFILQGGDFVFGNGSGGESIFGKKFKDERAGLLRKHSSRGILSMGNSGKNSNTSQFFITLAPAPQCDGKHVVFGKVISGFEILDYIEEMVKADGKGVEILKDDIRITECGVWTPLLTPAAGYWYDKPDPDAFSGISPLFLVRPRVALVVPNAGAAEKFIKSFGSHCVVADMSGDDVDNDPATTSSRILNDWLGAFRADVVIVAPACKDVLQQVTQLPESWTRRQPWITINQVVMEAKPVEALSRVHQQSWLNKQGEPHWQLDGAM